LDLDELKGFGSKSNWERYFANIVDCDDRYLVKRWDSLYDLRCMIAHNAIVGRGDYNRIRQLVDEVAVHLQEAIDNIDRVHVPKADKEQVAESVASSISAHYQEFIQLWKSFESALMRTQAGLDGEGKRALTVIKPPVRVLWELHEKELIGDALLAEGTELVSFRNRLVHDPGVTFSDQEIQSYIARLEDFTDALKRKWKDEIVEALTALGGEATLAEIYGHIERNTLRELPDTWEATVRYTLALNSSDTATYRGGDDLFEHLDRGRWGLRDFKKGAAGD
jgi:hypothetical protein